MKIAMIGQKNIPSEQADSLESHVEELGTRLVHGGNKVFAYLSGSERDTSLSRFNGIDLLYIPRIFTVLHASLVLRPDIIHLHGINALMFSWIPRIFCPSTTVIATVHDSHLSKKNRLSIQIAIRFAHTLITTKKTMRNEIAVKYKKYINFIPSGIKVKRVATSDLVLSPLMLKSGAYIAVTADSKTDVNLIVDIWKIAKSKSPNLFKGKKLAMIGLSCSKQEDDILYIKKQRQSIMNALFAGALCILNPSSIVEAMSYGKAVIAPSNLMDYENIEEYFIMHDNEVNQISQSLIGLLEDPMLAASIGHSAREYVETELNWDDIARETQKIYARHYFILQGKFAVR